VKTAEDRAVLELFIARQIYSRPFVAPPDLPQATVQALRQGFAAMARDPEFLRDAAQAGLEVNVTPGAEMKSVIDAVLASPREVVERAATELTAAQ
jgi:tripartite-type tricarboxylate transporter receptor subunit TctC